jgi:hypothetical protein
MGRRILFVSAFLMLLSVPAALACQGCCTPPPYKAPECCYTICGTESCLTTRDEFGTFCESKGNFCGPGNYCQDGFGEPGVTNWVRCDPPLATKWRLASVSITVPRSLRVKRS